MVKRSIFGCLILFVFLLLTGCKNDNSAKENLVEVKDVKMTGEITEQGYLVGNSTFYMKNSDLFPLPEEIDSSIIMYIKMDDKMCTFPMSIGLKYGLVVISGKFLSMNNINRKANLTLNYLYELKSISGAD
jgi:predicted ribonuclease toxin of YeeF-YezG toxin-antitoxin module